jgi:tetraacyldisaccharide 4'-kinase
VRGILLLPFTAVYYVANIVWDIYWKARRPVKVGCKVISVGNITVGGSGKTTLAGYVCKALLADNHKVALVARGYGRRHSGFVICGDGNEVDWEKCGDEPAAMARSIPGLRIYIDSDKTRAAQRAAADGFDYIVVDDGFQHRKLNRDLDIVCLDSARPFGNGLLLPSGNLREPRRSLKRADAAVMIGGSSHKRPPTGNLKLPMFLGTRRFKGAFSQHGNPANIHGSRLMAFCGLANPGSFMGTLQDAEYQVVDFMKFRDHHTYTERDVKKIEAAAERTHCDAAVTTLKDAVKLDKIWTSKLPLYHVEISLELDNENAFVKLIAR